jgi:fatty acid synthase subunit beta
MPFDGILLGSRMLVAKEALTSNPVKHLLAEGCTGVPSERQSEWEQTYDHPLGGIVTVTSELGEPIHKVRNVSYAASRR